jgi:hypothetical protein
VRVDKEAVTAASLLAAIQIGGPGFCTGRQVAVASTSLQMSFSKLTLSSVQRRRTTSRHCSNRRTRWPFGTPNASNSVSR